MYGGMGLIRFLALSRVGTPGLVHHPLGERPPDWALCLLLHQGAQSQVCWENVRLCTGVTDIPEQEKHTVTQVNFTETDKEGTGNVTLPVNSSIKRLKDTLPDGS